MSLLYSEKLPMGWQSLEFKLIGTDDQQYSLSKFTKPGLLIVFTCNHCPYAKASWPVLIDLYQQFRTNVDFIAINPNDATSYPEDSFPEMKRLVKDLHIQFPYLWDEDQKVARNYQAQCTPDIYLFNQAEQGRELFYHGRINDNWQDPADIKEENLKDALKRLVDGQTPPDTQPPSMGCSIKWKQ